MAPMATDASRKPTTIKVWAESRHLLRVVAGLRGETLAETLHRVLAAELSRLRTAGALRQVRKGRKA